MRALPFELALTRKQIRLLGFLRNDAYNRRPLQS